MDAFEGTGWQLTPTRTQNVGTLAAHRECTCTDRKLQRQKKKKKKEKIL